MRNTWGSAALVATFVVAAFAPLALVDQLWMGPALIGTGLGNDTVLLVAGVAMVLAAVPPVLLLAVAAALARGARVPVRGTVACVLLVAAATAGPFHELATASWVPAGRALVVVLGAAAVVAVLRAGRAPASGRRSARPELAVGAAVVGLALVVSVPLSAVRDGLASAPSGLLAEDFLGGERLRGTPLDVPAGYGRPGLSEGEGTNIHHDAGMSDLSTGRRAVDAREADVHSFKAPGVCASLLFPPGRPWLLAVCVGPTRVVAHLVDRATLKPLAERKIADREVGPDVLTNFSGGGYASLDAEGRLVVGTADGYIRRFAVVGGDAPRIVPEATFDVRSTLDGDEPINSALPDRADRIWYVGARGSVGVLDPQRRRARSVRFAGTDIENSFALAPDGDAFVVTSKELVRLRAGRDGPEVVWREAYDRGTQQKPGQTSRGSGTTPTVLLGGRYVAITDNAEPRMHVLVYDARPQADGPRLVCRRPVFAAGRSATDNSLIAAGRSLFVENNHGYKLLDVRGGHTSEPGLARIDLVDGGCRTAWESDAVSIPSVVSKVSAADGTVLSYTKPRSRLGIDAWYFTAVDAGSGEVLWRRLAGAGPLVNNHYAALYLGPDGRIYVGATGGIVALL